jgi:hypothetical protein
MRPARLTCRRCVRPEGEAQQGEWNEDGSLFIGTDEDLTPFRLSFEIAGGPAAGEYIAEEFSWTIPISTLPDQRVNAPVVFGGYGCPGDRAAIPASVLDSVTAPGEDQIVVYQRGPVEGPNSPGESCFFSEKVESAQLAGRDAVREPGSHVHRDDPGAVRRAPADAPAVRPDAGLHGAVPGRRSRRSRAGHR